MHLKSGFKKLDTVLGGGFPEKTTILLSGGPGAGKTIFSLAFLNEGLVAGERCCYVSLSESPDEILRAAQGIESLHSISPHIGKNGAIEHITLGEHITMKKFNEIISSYPKLDRLIIDNVNKLLIYTESPRAFRIHLAELVRQLKKVSRCTMLLCETENDHWDTGHGEAFECDGVLTLSFWGLEEKPRRALYVRKMRFAAFDPHIPHELVISPRGVRLAETSLI